MNTVNAILCLHDLPSLSHKLCFFARSGPPFVIRSVLIGWGCSGFQMVDLSERENRLWGRERGDRANTELVLFSCNMVVEMISGLTMAQADKLTWDH